MPRAATAQNSSAGTAWAVTQASAAWSTVRPQPSDDQAISSAYSHGPAASSREYARKRLQPCRNDAPAMPIAPATEPPAIAASSSDSTPCGRTSSCAARAPQAMAAPTSAPPALASTTLVKSRGRASGRWAAKTRVASAAPKLARPESTSALTVTNATAPRSDGSRPRASNRTETK